MPINSWPPISAASVSKQAIQHSDQLSAIAFALPVPSSVQNTFQVISSYSAPAAGGRFTAFPKVQTIAEKAGVSVRTIHYHLKQLVQAGVITITHRYRKCRVTNQARQISSLYSINLFRVKQLLHKLKIRTFAVKPCRLRSVSKETNKNKGFSAFNQSRFEQANAEHDQRLAEAAANKVSSERGISIIRDIRSRLKL